MMDTRFIWLNLMCKSMKKLFLKYVSMVSLVALYACQEDTPKADVVNQWLSPEERKLFFSQQKHYWKLSRLRFDEPTVVPELSENPFQIDSTLIYDLYDELADCRKDDVYSFSYSYGDVMIDFTDRYEQEDDRCDPQAPSHIEDGNHLNFDDSLRIAQAEFWDNHAVRQFFGFNVSRVGAAYSGFSMEWRIESITSDSITFHAFYKKQELPPLSIQFIPVENPS